VTEPEAESTEIAKVLTPTDKAQQVVTWILEGNSDHAILEAIAEEWPEDDAAPLIAAALTSLKESSSVDVELVTGWCFQATRFVYQKMVETGDNSGALRAIKQLREMASR